MTNRTSLVVTMICWAMVVLEGYDLIAYGTVLPVLLNDPGSGFDATTAGVVASMAFVGMLFGALASGWMCDRVGRRPVAIGALVWFSVFTALCAAAGGPVSLGVLRLVGGVGLGAIVPAASALTLEYARSKHRTLAYALMLSGVPIGGVLAALTGIFVLADLGWRFMFLLAVVPAVAVLPFAWYRLPESLVFLLSRGRHEAAVMLAVRLGAAMPELDVPPGAGVFRHGYRAASLLFAAATFCGLLAWFGLGTWLPGIMRATGYDIGSSLVFLLVLNLGAIAGSLVIATASDRWDAKLVTVLTYGGMTMALLVLLTRLPQLPLLVAIAVAGVGGHGGQILINTLVGRSYPVTLRARALGWSLGAGRAGTILGPPLVGVIVSGHSPRLGFLVFGGAALGSAILLSLVPSTPHDSSAPGLPALRPAVSRCKEFRHAKSL